MTIISLQQHALLMNTNRSNKWPDLLVQMLDASSQTVQSLGIDAELSEKIALSTIRSFADLFGGLQVYLPKGEALNRALRDREIYQQAGKVSASTLAHKYNLSMKQIWEIQRKQKNIHKTPIIN